MIIFLSGPKEGNRRNTRISRPRTGILNDGWKGVERQKKQGRL